MSFTRRSFLKSAAAASSFMFLPGVGRIEAKPVLNNTTEDYTGRLAYNENPLGPSPLAITAMKAATSMAHRYPDWYVDELESAIADKYGVSSSQVCVGAGATEMIRLVADAFLGPGDEMITATPTYVQMEQEAEANGATVVRVPVDSNYGIDINAIGQAITDNTRMISLVNPNNPLGTIINKNDLQMFLLTLPSNIIVVVDEAYHDYVDNRNYESCIAHVKSGLNVIVIRTFSKVYGMAGARVGYTIASPVFTNQIAGVQNPGMLSNITQKGALAALDDTEHMGRTISLNSQSKYYMTDEFTGMGLEYIPSEANFIMVNVGDGQNIVSKLSSKGYIVRTGWDMSSHIRVTTGTMGETEGFIAALKSVLTASGISDASINKSTLKLGAYPNPFNNSCRIKISIPSNDKTTLAVYNMLGQKIKTLLNNKMTQGEYEFNWNGKDVTGRAAASGNYVIQLVHGETVKSMKTLLVK